MLPAAFMIVALILFIIAALGFPTGRFSLLAGGLAFWVAAEILKLGIL
jgi:hypothetical protein